ncbi:MAG: LacI family transcriptional regulator [Clostridiales bacterium]|nr:LacI family transcriptional regulator [Clostridiales bacterium]
MILPISNDQELCIALGNTEASTYFAVQPLYTKYPSHAGILISSSNHYIRIPWENTCHPEWPKGEGHLPTNDTPARKGLIGSLVRQSHNGLYYYINESIVRGILAAGYEQVTMEAQAGMRTEGALIDRFIDMGVSGVIITSNIFMTPDMFDRLRAAHIPAVAVEREYLSEGIDSLIVRDVSACRDVVERMMRAGHERIGLVAMKPKRGVEKQRYEGFLSAFHAAGIRPDYDLIRLVDGYDIQYGRIAGESLFALPKPPTALLCTADLLAAGVMQAAFARGLRVPDDLSIVGYDDVISKWLSPPINSVGLIVSEIGANVMELLEKRMADPDRPTECRMIDTVYADRGSVRTLDRKKETVIRFE